MKTSSPTKYLFRYLGRFLLGVPTFVLGGSFVFFPDAYNVAGSTISAIPSGLLFIIGLLFMVGGAMIVIDKYKKYAGYGVAFTYLLLTTTGQIPGLLSEDTMNTVALMALLKDLAIAGGAIVLASRLETTTQLEEKLARAYEQEGKSKSAEEYRKVAREKIKEESPLQPEAN